MIYEKNKWQKVIKAASYLPASLYTPCTHFRHMTSLSFQLQPHLWCNTPTLGLYKRTWTSRRPGHPEDWLRLSSHSAGSKRQTELFSFPSLERRPGWTAALEQAGRTTRSDRTLKVKTAAAGRMKKPKNLIRLANSLLQVLIHLCSHYYVNSCESSTAMRKKLLTAKMCWWRAVTLHFSSRFNDFGLGAQPLAHLCVIYTAHNYLSLKTLRNENISLTWQFSVSMVHHVMNWIYKVSVQQQFRLFIKLAKCQTTKSRRGIKLNSEEHALMH